MRRSIDQTINSLQLPIAVENKALEIYNNLSANIKKKCKLQTRAYFVIVEAYKSLGKVYDLNDLKKQLGGISKDQIKTIIKDASRDGYQLVIYHYTPYDFVEDICYRMGINESHYDSINELIDLLLKIIYPVITLRIPIRWLL